ASVENFDEVILNTGFYADYVFDSNVILYLKLDYNSITDDLERADIFEFYTGMKYQFDILVN
ncbi:hypothetical protein ACFLYK_04345, partial [Candidatus Cloacimonadota bacterium]